MKKVEQYIRKNTNQFSNEDGFDYVPWLTPDEAMKAAKIAREETINEVCEWLDNHTMLSEKWYIEDLKKHLDSKL